MAARKRRTASPAVEPLTDSRGRAASAVSSLWRGVDPVLLRISVFFVATFGIFNAVLLGMGNSAAFQAVKEGTARFASVLIALTGVPAARVGSQIVLSSRILRIDPDCTGLTVVAIYLALLVGYPVTLRTKGVGALVGVPAILLANMLRLVAAAHMSEWFSPQAFDYAHDYFYKVFLVAVVIGLWAWWLAYARRQARR